MWLSCVLVAAKDNSTSTNQAGMSSYLPPTIKDVNMQKIRDRANVCFLAHCVRHIGLF